MRAKRKRVRRLPAIEIVTADARQIVDGERVSRKTISCQFKCLT